MTELFTKMSTGFGETNPGCEASRGKSSRKLSTPIGLMGKRMGRLQESRDGG